MTVGLLGCQPEEFGPKPRIEIMGANSGEVPFDARRRPGAAFSNQVILTGPRRVRVTALRSIADEGLRVRYLGICAPGCPGATSIKSGTRIVSNNLVATLPFDLVRGEPVSLAFILEPDGAAGLKMLEERCLRFTELVFTLEGGASQRVGSCCESFIDAIHPPPKGGHARCEERIA